MRKEERFFTVSVGACLLGAGATAAAGKDIWAVVFLVLFLCCMYGEQKWSRRG